MCSTSNSQVNLLLNELQFCIRKIFGHKLQGLYVYGSFVTKDFDYNISDIDLLAVVSKTVNRNEFVALKRLHTDFANKHLEWSDRIEVQYISASCLRTFKTHKSSCVRISPGEPTQFVKAGKDYLLNWYDVQENGQALFGPSQTEYIPRISVEEYRTALKKHVKYIEDWIKSYNGRSKRGPIAFMVLTLCRIMYGLTIGKQVSKTKAAAWAIREFPQWADLITDAIAWRKAQWEKEQKRIGSDLERSLKFKNFITNQIGL